jgi:hypothetical protein
MIDQKESEEQLIERAQRALTHCNWEIGECASKWTQRYARGRTDADFGAQIGLSGDQVFQRRRVWDTFNDVYEQYPTLRWSHFYAALNWDDSPECLQWSSDMQATVAEMKAWRRAQHGEDLTAPAEDEEPAAPPVELLTPEAGVVRDLDSVGSGSPVRGEPDRAAAGSNRDGNTVLEAARESSAESEYAPYGKSARGDFSEKASENATPSAEQALKRIASSLERCDAALTPDVLQAWNEAPVKVRQRIQDSIDNLRSKTAGVRI